MDARISEDPEFSWSGTLFIIGGFAVFGLAQSLVAVARRRLARRRTLYITLLDGRDGMSPAVDGGWNATAYVWHLVDLARGWSERWVLVASVPGSLLAGWDPDVLAEARNYRALPTVSALWALTDATDRFVELSGQLDPDTPFLHGDWGLGTVADGTRWLAHEFVHHQLDVDERAASAPESGAS